MLNNALHVITNARDIEISAYMMKVKKEKDLQNDVIMRKSRAKSSEHYQIRMCAQKSKIDVRTCECDTIKR